MEVRSPGMDKGKVVRDLAEEVDAGGFLFAGDDLGDVEAFDAVAELRCRACPRSWSARRPRRRARSSSSPTSSYPALTGVLDLLRRLTADARALG